MRTLDPDAQLTIEELEALKSPAVANEPPGVQWGVLVQLARDRGLTKHQAEKRLFKKRPDLWRAMRAADGFGPSVHFGQRMYHAMLCVMALDEHDFASAADHLTAVDVELRDGKLDVDEVIAEYAECLRWGDIDDEGVTWLKVALNMEVGVCFGRDLDRDRLRETLVKRLEVKDGEPDTKGVSENVVTTEIADGPSLILEDTTAKRGAELVELTSAQVDVVKAVLEALPKKLTARAIKQRTGRTVNSVNQGNGDSPGMNERLARLGVKLVGGTKGDPGYRFCTV